MNDMMNAVVLLFPKMTGLFPRADDNGKEAGGDG
jgi:hypothetical protein